MVVFEGRCIFFPTVRIFSVVYLWWYIFSVYFLAVYLYFLGIIFSGLIDGTRQGLPAYTYLCPKLSPVQSPISLARIKRRPRPVWTVPGLSQLRLYQEVLEAARLVSQLVGHPLLARRARRAAGRRPGHRHGQRLARLNVGAES